MQFILIFISSSTMLLLAFFYNFVLICRNLKLPSRQPAIVCENCLYSQEKDRRVRAFHIMDPKGILEMLLIFLEDRDGGVLFPPFLENVGVSPKTNIKLTIRTS